MNTPGTGIISTGSTMIEIGSRLKIGYKPYSDPGQFNYLVEMPLHDQLPYKFSLPIGYYDIQYIEICPTCTTPTYSTPIQISVDMTVPIL